MKRKLRFLFHVFCMVTTCVVFAVALFTTVWDPSETVDAVTLWQIPSVSFLCTLGCLIYPWDRNLGKKEMIARMGIHYIYINAVVLGAGYQFRWYHPDHLRSVIAMLLTIAVIFMIVSVISWTKSAEDARRMNERLKEYRQKGENKP